MLPTSTLDAFSGKPVITQAHAQFKSAPAYRSKSLWGSQSWLPPPFRRRALSKHRLASLIGFFLLTSVARADFDSLRDLIRRGQFAQALAVSDVELKNAPTD